MGKEMPLKKIMFVCNNDPVHYKWSSQELTTLSDCRLTAEMIRSKLEANNIKLRGLYAIMHRSEKQNQFWASHKHEKDANFKEFQNKICQTKHFHILIFFEEDSKLTLSNISTILGVPIASLDVIKNEDNCLSYLCHCKYPKKFQYKKNDVITLVGVDFGSIYDARCAAWFNGIKAATEYSSKKETQALFKKIISKYRAREITYEEIFCNDDFISVITNPYYVKQLKEQKKIFDEINAINKEALIKKIVEQEIISLDSSIGILLYDAYIAYQPTIDQILVDNVCKMIINKKISIHEIKQNVNLNRYLSLYSYKIYSAFNQIMTMELENITKLKEINNIIYDKDTYDIYNHSKRVCDNLIAKILLREINEATLDIEIFNNEIIYNIYINNYEINHNSRLSTLIEKNLIHSLITKSIMSLDQLKQNRILNHLYNNFIEDMGIHTNIYHNALKYMINKTYIKSINEIYSNELYLNIYELFSEHEKTNIIQSLQE